jgi:hypothetical protein
MSRDPAPARATARRAARAGLLAAALVLALPACGTQPVEADERTRRIAVVEFERQCAIDAVSFPVESGITADLESRLAAAGLTHEEWKDWRDALVGSPELVAQLAAAGRGGCPA